MPKQGLLKYFKIVRIITCLSLLFVSFELHASFIEATVGTAVVNDATAAYYNPAALTLLKNPQIVGLGSAASLHTQFSGQATQPGSNFKISGSDSTKSNFYLPSAYFGWPCDKIAVGVAVITNFFNRDFDDHSILRYSQSGNRVQDIDVVPAIGVKLDDYVSLGAAISVSRVNILLEPISGFPSLNIPDSQSRNEGSATSWGADVGILIKPCKTTLIGFNYRSAVSYQISGKSVLETNPPLTSNHYTSQLWTPAHNVISISQMVTKTLGFIGTVQYIQWNIFKDAKIQGIATQIGPFPVIIPNATAHFHLHNSWIFTAGSHYRITPEWIVRVAGSFIQSPSNPDLQISNGDSIVLGASTAYDINKYFTVDASYAHAFIENENVHVKGRNIINGVNKAYRDAVSLKLTYHFV